MYIFLDIDGVMVHAKAWKTIEILSDNFYSFNSESISALNSIIGLYNDVKITLTSSHRDKFTIEKWMNIFKNRGVNISSINKLPISISYQSRKNEIENYIISNNINNYLIIDDDTSLNDLPINMKENLLLTSSYIGLNMTILK